MIGVSLCLINTGEVMTPKSYITLCVIGILYVIMAAVAVVSPHGGSYALDTAGGTGSSDAAQSDTASSNNADASIPSTNDVTVLRLVNDAGTCVELPLEGMPAFSPELITVNVNGTTRSFTAVDFHTVALFSGLQASSDIIIVKDSRGNAVMYRTVDLLKEDNAYIIYGNENGEPLDKDEYGVYCLYLAQGTHTGMLLDMSIVDFG